MSVLDLRMTAPSSSITSRLFLVRTFLFSIVALWAGASSAIAQEDKTSESTASVPPIKRMIFYSTGIAQVIHEGTIEGNQTISLNFAETQIDDVLKSLIFEDQDGGTIKSVVYHPALSQEDLAAEHLWSPLTVAQILQTYRGEKVTLVMDAGEKSGSIVGVENRTSGEDSFEALTLLTDSGLETFRLEAANSIQFENEDVRTKFAQAMIGLANSRGSDEKRLDLHFSGKGKRTVRFAYVIDAPIWRMTYRLDLASKQSTLQGWAHIDNVAGIDWKNVQVELRNGRARSFHASVFEPLLGQRAGTSLSVYGIPTELNVIGANSLARRNQSFAIGNSDVGKFNLEEYLGGDDWYANSSSRGGYGGGGMGGGGFGGGLGGGGLGARGGAGGGLFGGPTTTAKPMSIQSGFESVAGVGRASRMVKFEIEELVSLAAGESAMLPVITQKIPSKLITKFSHYQKGTSPQLLVEIENKTPNAFVPGPATVYQNGDFVGDAKMPRVEINDFAELNYGIDQPVSIEGEKTVPATKLVSAKFVEDKIQLTSIQTEVLTIKIENKDIDPRDVLLSRPIIESTPDPAPTKIDKGVHQYRYEVAANSNSNNTITYTMNTASLMPYKKLPEGAAAMWKKEGVEVGEKLAKWLKTSDEISGRRKSAQSDLYLLQGKIRRAKDEQTRLLEIIKTLTATDDGRESYVKSVAKFEEEITTLAKSVDAQQKLVDGIMIESSQHIRRFGNIAPGPFGN